jgi:hypothetical protein
VNQGGSSITYQEITSYNGFASIHIVSVEADNLTPGVIYKFKYRAVNIYGESDWSEELNAGLSSQPAKPNPLRKIEAESGETHITLEWDMSLDTELPVIGYNLKVNDGVGGNVYSNILSASRIFPNVRKYVIGDLITGY